MNILRKTLSRSSRGWSGTGNPFARDRSPDVLGHRLGSWRVYSKLVVFFDALLTSPAMQQDVLGWAFWTLTLKYGRG